MRKLANASATNTAQEQSEIYWWRVSTFTPASGPNGGSPTVALDGSQIAVDSLTYGVCALDKPWRRLETLGTVTVEYGDNPREPFPGPINSGGNSPTTDGVRASATAAFSDVGAVSNPALFDQTSAVNTPLDTGTIDLTPWRYVLVEVIASAGTSAFTLSDVDDTGATVTTPLDAPAAALTLVKGYGPGCGGNFPLPRRGRFQAGAAGIGNTVRMRITGRR